MDSKVCFCGVQMNPELWGKVADCIVMLLVPAGVVCSAYLLASTALDSVCVKAPSLLKVILQILPICLTIPAVATSGIVRDGLEAEESRDLLVGQAITGVMLMAWMCICMFGASAFWVLTIGAMLVAGVLGSWTFLARLVAQCLVLSC